MTVGGHSLPDTAQNQHLFLKRNTDFHVKRVNIKGLEQLIVTVKDLLRTLHRNASPHSTASGFPAGFFKQDPNLDPTYTANLEHLLLCLEQQLVLQFIKQLVDIVRKNIFDCQRDHERLYKEWFFEYPDARHPLSTTWPWAIKPSLAVLWGVCWMFHGETVEFDNFGNLLDASGRILLPREMVMQYLTAEQGMSQQRSSERQRQQRQRQHGQSEQYEQQQQYHQQGQVYSSEARLGQGGNTRSQIAEMVQPRQPPQPHHLATNSATPSPSTHTRESLPYTLSVPFCLSYPSTNPPIGAREQAAIVHSGLSVDNTYTAAPTAAYPVADVSGWLPEVANFPEPGLGGQYNAYAPLQAEGLWSLPNQTGQTLHYAQVSQQPGESGVPRSLPPRRSGQTTPEIRLDTNFSNTLEYQALPQESHSSSATSYTTPYSDFAQYPVQQTHLSPQYSRPQGFQPRMAEVQPPPMAQMQPTGIQSPVSDNQQSMQPSPRQSPMPETMSRKRSHSEMSQPAMEPLQQQMVMHELPSELPYQNEQQSAQGSPYEGMQPAPEETTVHKVKRAFTRPEAPRTAEGKLYCEWSEDCAGLLFDRPCEWK